MKMIASSMDLKRIEEWSSIAGKKLVFYHNDPDGISSAALWLAAFPEFEAVAREGPIMKPSFVRWIAGQDPDVLVFLDLPVDQEWKKIQWLCKQYKELKIIIIDHHIPDKDLNSDQIIHINNKLDSLFKDKYLPAAFTVYNVLYAMAGADGKEKLERMKWVAGAGIIGDYGQRDCADFFKGIRSRMKAMDQVADLISAAVTLKGRKGADRVLKILLRVKDEKEFLERKMLQLWKRYVDGEIAETMKEYRKGKEGFKELNLVMFRIKSKLNIVSVISTLLSEKHPRKIILIYKLSAKGMWKVSGRLQNGRLDLGSLFKQVVKGNGSGGGHKQAAGARVNDWDKFKRKLLAGLKEEKNAKRR